MISEDQLREKLRKIEALYAGAKTDGEKSAAGAAAERIRVKFENASKQERAEEFKFSITDPWSRQLFIALCRRYGIKPFRYTRMHRQTVIIRAPASFRSEEHTSELQSLMRTPYAVSCLKKKKNNIHQHQKHNIDTNRTTKSHSHAYRT